MLERLLVTGATGGIGTLLRHKLKPLAKTLRLSDVADLGHAGENEEIVPCDLADRGSVRQLVEGCDGILHLGGISLEKSFDTLLGPNIVGVYNLYEAARACGSPRILFASSNHVTGFHEQGTLLTAEASLRPDGLYGVTKCFGEAMARMYHDKFGLETAIVRIGWCAEEAQDHRKLSIWMSPDDFLSLVACVFTVSRLGCPVIYGVSNNDTVWWDNSAVSYLGWHPKDNAAKFRETVDATMPRPPKDACDAVYQGGKFTIEPIQEE